MPWFSSRGVGVRRPREKASPQASSQSGQQQQQQKLGSRAAAAASVPWLRLLVYYLLAVYMGWALRVATRPSSSSSSLSAAGGGGGFLCGLLPVLPRCRPLDEMRGGSLRAGRGFEPLGGAAAPGLGGGAELLVKERPPERLLFMLSSFDRGERLANWKGEDKMEVR